MGGARTGRAGSWRLPPSLGLLLSLVACSGDVIGEFPSPPTPAITASPSEESDEGILAEIAVDGSPCFLAEAGGRVWVAAFDGDELIEIDPATNEVIATHRMPGGPCGMVEREGTLWIETPDAGTLVAFDPDRGRVIDRIGVRGGVTSVASTPTGLWGVAAQAEQVVQIDPDSGEVQATIDLEGPLGGLVSARGQIWATAGGGLARIDPGTRSVVERIELESFEPEALAVGGNFLWVSSSFEGTVLRVDLRTGEVRDRLPVDDSLFGGAVIGDSYWVSANNTIYRLDASSGEVVDQLDLVGFGPFPAAGDLWTVDFFSNTVFRLDERA